MSSFQEWLLNIYIYVSLCSFHYLIYYAMKKRKPLQIAVIALILLVLLALIGGMLAGKLAERSIRSILEGDPFPGHKIDFRKVKVSLLTFSGAIKDVTVKPEPIMLEEQIPDSLYGLPVINASVKKVSLKNLEIFDLLFRKNLRVSAISIRSPEINYSIPATKHKKVQQEKKEGNIMEELDSFNLELIEIINGNFYLSEKGKEPFLFSDNYNLSLSGIEMTMDEKFAFNEDITFKQGIAQLTGNQFLLPGELYELKAGEINLNYSDSLLLIRQFKLIPNFSKEEFGWKNGSQTDRFDISIDTIQASDIHFSNLMMHLDIRLGNLALMGADINIYRDKNVPFDFSKYPRLPHQSLVEMPLSLLIDSLDIEQVNLQYEELQKGGDAPGIISLTDGNIRVYNITSTEKAISKKESMRIAGRFMLQGKAPFDMEIDLPYAQRFGEFTYSGSIGKMELKELNSITLPSEGINILEGNLDSFNFSMNANEVYALGTSRFYYHDIKIEILKKDKGIGEDHHSSSFLSSLANIALRNDNPHRNRPGKVAIAHFIRDRNKGIVNLMVKPLIKSMVNTLTPGNRYLFDDGNTREYKRKLEKVLNEAEKDLTNNK